MATRQYIGGRYVPKFYVNSVDGSAQWEANVVYEPLIFVTLTNAHMYLSKKQVPATVGTPASNPEYWLDVGNYNGFIEDLQNQIDTINNTTIPAVSDRVTELEKKHKRVVLYIGDSYMAGPGVLVTSMNARLNPDTSYNYSHGATGFIRDTDGKNFLHQLQDAAAGITDKDSVTDIVMAGGINDAYENTESSYTSAIASIKTYIRSNFKNAKVWIVPMLWGNMTWTLSDTRKYVNMFKGLITSGYAVYPYAFQILMGLGNEYMADSSHPNAAGCNMIADYLCSWINGGISLVDRKKDISETIQSTSAIAGSYLLRNGFVYGHFFLYLRDHTFAAGETIFTFPNWFIFNASTRFAIRQMVTAGSFSGNLYLENGSLKTDSALVNVDMIVDFEIPLDFLYG